MTHKITGAEETYRSLFRGNMEHCIKKAEDLDDVIEMAYNCAECDMEDMKNKYADFIIFSGSALRYGYLGRVITRSEFIQEHLNIDELSELFGEYLYICECYPNNDCPEAELEEARCQMQLSGDKLIARIDDLADSLAFFVIKMKREEE